MAVLSFAALDGQCFQQANPGGGRNLFAILAKDIVGNYPLDSHISADGTELTALPTLVATKKWSQYAFPDGTLDYKVDDGGDPSFQSYKHMIEFMLAGKSKAVRAEMAKYINAGALFLVEDKDGDYILIGSTDDPIFLKKSFALGKKGNDKRGYTLKGEVDGVTFGVVTLASTLLATFSPNLVPLPA
ncbi:MAG: hypothetical protein ACRCVT_03735 [Leadbetterella sp.]